MTSTLDRIPMWTKCTFVAAVAVVTGACGGGDDEQVVAACDPHAKGTICTIVGTGVQAFGGDNGPAIMAQLNVPQDMVVSPEGELWLLDFNNYLVRAVDKKGNIRTVIGTGLLGDSPDPGEERVPALQAKFNHTTDLFFDDGYLYLAAWHNSRVKRVRLSDMTLENYAGIGKRTFYTGDEGPALKAAVDLPSSIGRDPEGNVVLMDQANQVIRMVDHDGVIHRIAGKCVIDADAPCATGVMPVACPPTANYGPSDKFTCGDPATTCSKPCTPSFGGDDGACLEARMGQPFGQMADPAGRLAYDSTGNLYFADTSNSRIRRVSSDGVVTTVAGTGKEGYSGDGGPAIKAQINHPVDVEVGPDDTVYFTDVHNNCVRKIDASGTISAVVGVCSANPADRGFSGDGGDPLKAHLNRPYGIELAGDKMYVADSYNNRIRVVNF